MSGHYYGNKSIDLGALDLGQLSPNSPGDAVIRNTVALARALDSLQYSRLWIGEHHGVGVAHSCPEAFLPIIASTTCQIKVGTAGILLRYYSPLKIAKLFRHLDVLSPGRIELGLARGRVLGRARDFLLNGRESEGDFIEQTRFLVAALRGACEDIMNPTGVRPINIWMMSQGEQSMRLAASLGIGLCVSLMHSQDTSNAPAIIEEYRKRFIAHSWQAKPSAAIALAGICADTKLQATELMPKQLSLSLAGTFVGDCHQWRRHIEKMVRFCNVNNVIVCDLCESLHDRIRSYSLIRKVIPKAKDEHEG